MVVEKLDPQNFEDFTSDGEAIVYFYAEWCGPCKIMAPEFERASKEIKNVRFGKLNVDGAQDIVGQLGVMSIPTTIFFKDGQPVDRVSGAIDAGEIKERIEKAF